MVESLASAIYIGKLRHRRFEPKAHAFEYQVMMCYLDLDERDRVFKQHPLWGLKWYAFVYFKRKDYFGDCRIGLKESVQKRVSTELGRPINGAVRMLTNFRMFGFVFNPITIYYCFDEQQQLQALLLEVSNTPWGEKHAYALNCDPTLNAQRIYFDKQMHVSPFMPMDILYQLNCKTPSNALVVNMQNKQQSENGSATLFDASLVLKKSDMSPKNMSSVLYKFPFMTFKVVAAIYWQALRIFSKRIPFLTHPKKDLNNH